MLSVQYGIHPEPERAIAHVREILATREVCDAITYYPDDGPCADPLVDDDHTGEFKVVIPVGDIAALETVELWWREVQRDDESLNAFVERAQAIRTAWLAAVTEITGRTPIAAEREVHGRRRRRGRGW